MSERRITAIRGGGLTALIERPTNIRSFEGCRAMSPGTSISTLPSTRLRRSSLRTLPAPISVTYQALPSGSTWMWWGLALSPSAVPAQIQRPQRPQAGRIDQRDGRVVLIGHVELGLCRKRPRPAASAAQRAGAQPAGHGTTALGW